MAKKYYGVRKGKKVGVYSNWDDCKEQIDGYSGAEYKSFPTLEEANEYIKSISVCQEIKKNEVIKNMVEAYVDGSFEIRYGMYSYGCVIICNNKVTELSGASTDMTYVDMRNVAGELMGCQVAINWAIDHCYKEITVYYDYEGIEKWANHQWKANKIGTKEYVNFIDKQRELININFVKVLAHSGVQYNERADQLAKHALLEKNIDAYSKNSIIDENPSKIIKLNKWYENFLSYIKNNNTNKNEMIVRINQIDICEQALTNFIKYVWNKEAFDVSLITSIESIIDVNNRVILWKVVDINNKIHSFSIDIK